MSVGSAFLYVIALSSSDSNISLELISLFLCKFGVTAAFNLSYTIMRELFETLVRATSFGICNVTARLITISAPMLSKTEQPIPMIIIIGFSAIAGTLSLFLRPISGNNLNEIDLKSNSPNR